MSNLSDSTRQGNLLGSLGHPAHDRQIDRSQKEASSKVASSHDESPIGSAGPVISRKGDRLISWGRCLWWLTAYTCDKFKIRWAFFNRMVKGGFSFGTSCYGASVLGLLFLAGFGVAGGRERVPERLHRRPAANASMPLCRFVRAA